MSYLSDFTPKFFMMGHKFGDLRQNLGSMKAKSSRSYSEINQRRENQI